jgi:hypothetical protein
VGVFNRGFRLGDVAQLVRALPCHGRGRWFEPSRPRHFKERKDYHESKEDKSSMST